MKGTFREWGTIFVGVALVGGSTGINGWQGRYLGMLGVALSLLAGAYLGLRIHRAYVAGHES